MGAADGVGEGGRRGKKDVTRKAGGGGAGERRG